MTLSFTSLLGISFKEIGTGKSGPCSVYTTEPPSMEEQELGASAVLEWGYRQPVTQAVSPEAFMV